jgi:crossover junction endodeoxyribonuclease RuvC
MRILGIDPGSTVTGYGIIDFTERRTRVVACGVVRVPARKPFPQRLRAIYDGIQELISTHNPEQVAVEDLFYAANVKSALRMGHARGVVLLAVARHDIPISEYSPREIKLAVAGSGAASKEQVRRMVQALLDLDEAPAKMDTSDALAVALCHLHRLQGATGLAREWR